MSQGYSICTSTAKSCPFTSPQGQFSGIVCIQKTPGWPCITTCTSIPAGKDFLVHWTLISLSVNWRQSVYRSEFWTHWSWKGEWIRHKFYLYEKTCSFYGLLPTVLNLWLPDERSSIFHPHGKILQVLKYKRRGWHKCNLPCTAEEISQANVAILKAAQTAAFAKERSVLLAKRIVSENICVGTLNWVLQKRSL